MYIIPPASQAGHFYVLFHCNPPVLPNMFQPLVFWASMQRPGKASLFFSPLLRRSLASASGHPPFPLPIATPFHSRTLHPQPYHSER